MTMGLSIEDFAALGGMLIVLLTPVYALTWAHTGLIAEQTTCSKLIMARLDVLETSHKQHHGAS